MATKKRPSKDEQPTGSREFVEKKTGGRHTDIPKDEVGGRSYAKAKKRLRN